MNLILDNNILFSLMNPHSMTSFIFLDLNAILFAPEFIIEEFNRYEEECRKKSKLDKFKFAERKKVIFSKINFLKLKDFNSFVEPARKFCPGENDVFYFALALELKAPIWSNDKELKNQNKVVVLDTRDIINLYLS
ncbi:MAG: PIN domain-containing protein [Nanoarchaeota archaeon]